MHGFARGGCALFLAALSTSLLAASIFPTVVWYEDAEVQKTTDANGATITLNVNWQATLTQWCTVGTSQLSTSPGTIAAFCWTLDSALTGASMNPNNDPNLQSLLQDSEMADAANEIQSGSLLAYIAIAIGLAGLSFLMCCMGLALGWNHRLNPYSLLYLSRAVGCCGWVAPFVAIWLYLSALNQAGSDAKIPLMPSGNWQMIGPWGLTTGYWLLVSGTAAALASCLFTLFTCPDELDPDTNYGKGNDEVQLEGLDSTTGDGTTGDGTTGATAAGTGNKRHLRGPNPANYPDIEQTQTTQEFMENGGHRGLPAPPQYESRHTQFEQNNANWHYHDGPPPMPIQPVAGGSGQQQHLPQGPYAGYATIVIPMPKMMAREAMKAAGGKKVSQVQEITGDYGGGLSPAASFFRAPKPKAAVSAAKKGATIATGGPSSGAASSSLAYANTVKK